MGRIQANPFHDDALLCHVGVEEGFFGQRYELFEWRYEGIIRRFNVAYDVTVGDDENQHHLCLHTKKTGFHSTSCAEISCSTHCQPIATYRGVGPRSALDTLGQRQNEFHAPCNASIRPRGVTND